MAKQKRATMREIAQATGYSMTTVSHVINRTRHVDVEARNRILQTADELGYNINRKNASSKNQVIGMVIADIRVDYFSELTKNVEQLARAAGYNLIYCDSEERDEDEGACIDMLLARGVSGIMLAPCNTSSTYSQLVEAQIPVVLVDRNIDSRSFDFVGIDNESSATQLTKCLWEQGARHIAFIGHRGPQYTTRERIEGYRRAMTDLGTFDPEKVILIDSHAEGRTHEITEFILQNPDLDGIVCQSSNACFEALDSLTELGENYVDRIHIASWDDSKWFGLLRVPVSAISQPMGDIAAVATELLIDKINNIKRNSIPKKIILDYELKLRPTE